MARLRALGQTLPGDAVTVLEAPLAPAAGGYRRIDLSVRITEPAQAAALGERHGAAAGWRRFLRSWATRPDWRARVPSLWLEYDLERRRPGSPAQPRSGIVPPGTPAQPWPLVIAAPKGSAPKGPAQPQPIVIAPPADPAQLQPIVIAQIAAGVGSGWVGRTLLPALRGAPLAPLQRRLLDRCWREIPAGGRPLYVFALLPRRTDAIRLEVGCGSDLAALTSYVERLHLPVLAARLAALTPLLAEVERLHLSLDLSDAVATRFGVEVSFPRQPGRDPRWRRLLDRLTADGLCLPAARDAALSWPGQDSPWTAPERWPAGCHAAAPRCVRCISHIKLVCDQDRPTAAKVYLLVAPMDRQLLS